MVFDLEIHAGEDNAVTAHHLSVNVLWTQRGGSATATRLADGVEVARLIVWDEYPIEIHDNKIVIRGSVDHGKDSGPTEWWLDYQPSDVH